MGRFNRGNLASWRGGKEQMKMPAKARCVGQPNWGTGWFPPIPEGRLKLACGA